METIIPEEDIIENHVDSVENNHVDSVKNDHVDSVENNHVDIVENNYVFPSVESFPNLEESTI